MLFCIFLVFFSFFFLRLVLRFEPPSHKIVVLYLRIGCLMTSLKKKGERINGYLAVSLSQGYTHS